MPEDTSSGQRIVTSGANSRISGSDPVTDNSFSDPTTVYANETGVTDSTTSASLLHNVTITGTNITSDSVTIFVNTNDVNDTDFTTNDITTPIGISNEATGEHITNNIVGTENVTNNSIDRTDNYSDLPSATPTKSNAQDCKFLQYTDYFHQRKY